MGLPLSARRQNPSPASLAPQTMQTLRLEMPLAWTAPPCLWGALGILVALLVLFPDSDSSRQVPSTCQETEGPVLKGRTERAMTPQSLMRMNQEVLRHTRQSLAHSLRLLPERAGSTKASQVAASGLEAAGRPLLLAEKVRPHSLQGHLWDPSRPWPFLMKEE